MQQHDVRAVDDVKVTSREAPMRHQIRLFATTQGCTSGETARELMRAAMAELAEIYERGVIAGYKLLVLKEEDDYEDQDLDRPLIERETGGAFPALYLNVTYRIDQTPPDGAAIEPIVARYGFHHLLTESDDP